MLTQINLWKNTEAALGVHWSVITFSVEKNINRKSRTGYKQTGDGLVWSSVGGVYADG